MLEIEVFDVSKNLFSQTDRQAQKLSIQLHNNMYDMLANAQHLKNKKDWEGKRQV